MEENPAPGPLGWRSPGRVALCVAGVGERCQDLACSCLSKLLCQPSSHRRATCSRERLAAE